MGIFTAAGVFLLCALWGASRSSSLKKRVQLLNELRQLVTDFSVEIDCVAPTLYELCESCCGVFGELLREELKAAPDVRAAWSSAADRLSRCSFCMQPEQQIIRQLGAELGTCQASGQLSLLAMQGEKLAALYQKAQHEEQTRGRLYRSVGTLVGLGAAILVI